MDLSGGLLRRARWAIGVAAALTLAGTLVAIAAPTSLLGGRDG